MITQEKLYDNTSMVGPCSNVDCKKPTRWVLTIEKIEAAGAIPERFSGHACPRCVFKRRKWVKK